jgi:hypothetical protein
VVIAYLMWKNGSDFMSTLNSVRLQRPRVQPNDGFALQLRLLYQLGMNLQQWPGWNEVIFRQVHQQAQLQMFTEVQAPLQHPLLAQGVNQQGQQQDPLLAFCSQQQQLACSCTHQTEHRPDQEGQHVHHHHEQQQPSQVQNGSREQQQQPQEIQQQQLALQGQKGTPPPQQQQQQQQQPLQVQAQQAQGRQASQQQQQGPSSPGKKAGTCCSGDRLCLLM